MDIDKLSEEEIDELYLEYKKYCKENHLRCSTGCGTYDTIDRDCEIYGDYHPPISKCVLYFRRWLEEKMEKEEK